jgi:hypothetical protein
MTMRQQQPEQDPQDKQLGAAAKQDQERVDRLEDRGVSENDLTDKPAREVRAAGKAEPAPGEEDRP